MKTRVIATIVSDEEVIFTAQTKDFWWDSYKTHGSFDDIASVIKYLHNFSKAVPDIEIEYLREKVCFK